MPPSELHTMAIDCCEHTLAALGQLPELRITSVASRNNHKLAHAENEIYLIVVGVARYPVRRLFIGQLRRVYPDVPMLILRREKISEATERIRGEFILSDQSHLDDYDIVRSLRRILPLETCEHVSKGRNYDTIRDVIQIIAANYPDPQLDLTRVAREISMSPVHLSRILNQQVGVSFRQLLRHVRIEEAKRMLASGDFSVKQVASRVGFSDSHYFSRSFRELTGLSASEYKMRDAIFG
jgi:AraC-like DNA-binding protein